MELTHETTTMFTCLRAIDKTIVVIYVTNMATDMTLESLIQANRVEQFNLSYLAVSREETTIKPQISRAAVMTTDHTHHTKTDHMTLNLNLDDAATKVQTGLQTCKHCNRTNHACRKCKACFNCLEFGHFGHECRAPRSSNLNKTNICQQLSRQTKTTRKAHKQV